MSQTLSFSHRKRSFEDEMRAFFAKYHVEFDERTSGIEPAFMCRAFSPLLFVCPLPRPPA